MVSVTRDPSLTNGIAWPVPKLKSKIRNVPALISLLLMVIATSTFPAIASSVETKVGEEAVQPLSSGAVYYVRPDGGSQTQCTGLVNAPYPGNGTDQPCAWDHPFRALPPGGTARIAGGDTLIVAGGSYKMGYGAPGAANCDQAGSYDCHMPPVPSGLSPAQPTRILGAGWDTGCSKPPELWGSGRPWFIVNLTDSSNVEFSCFEITDHSSCVENHSGSLACERDTPPYGDWASIGMYAEDSANVLLRDLDIHGLASGGIHAGRLSDWTVENVRIAANGSVGWDGDLWNGSDSNSGTLTFRHWLVEWNGCGETYPGGSPTGCWGQEAGGYGDGVGTGDTGGNWIIEDSAFLHNTSDGLDLLYHTLGGVVSLNRVRAEGNAGNQVKVAGQTEISNSVLVGNCAFFEGKSYSYWVDHCRALGNTLELAFTGGEQISIINSTLYGQGDGLVGGGPRGGGLNCNGAETITARNSIFLGDNDYFDPGDITFLFYQEGCGNLKLNSDYNVVHKAKNVTCGQTGTYALSGIHDLCQNPLLSGPFSGTSYGMSLGAGSPAIDAGDEAICQAPPVNNLDQLRKLRTVNGNGDGTAACDIGALELQYALKAFFARSQATYDGWVLESAEKSGRGGTKNNRSKVFYVGDDASNRQYRGILSFDTSAMPDNAVITKITLKVKKAGLVGVNPFKTHKGLRFDIRTGKFGTRPTLQLSDFRSKASKNLAGQFSSTISSSWYRADLANSVYGYINKTGTTQFRLRFYMDNNNDFGADYFKFYSGNAPAASRPQLIVEYYVP